MQLEFLFHCPRCQQAMLAGENTTMDETSCSFVSKRGAYKLTPNEFNILSILHRNFGKLVTREVLDSFVDRRGKDCKSLSYINKVVHDIRVAIRGSGFQVHNEHGRGFVLKPGEWVNIYVNAHKTQL